MSESILQVRMDKTTKDSVEALYRDMGITFASAVRLFAKQSLVENGIPFIVSKTPKNAGGILRKYADISKMQEEKHALEKGFIDEYNQTN